MTNGKGRNQAADQADGLSLFEKRHQDYLRDFTGAQLDLTKRILAAQHDFQMSQIGSDTDEDAKAAASRYVEAVRGAWRESQTAYKSAHDNFVKGLEDALKGTGRDQLDPNGLVAIANGLAAVASQSAAALGNLDVFYATGVTPPEDALSGQDGAGGAS